MKPKVSPSIRSLGYWSAVFSSVFSIAYIIAQLLEWMGFLGSQGGPESMSTPMALVWLLTPSLLLGISFVILMVSIHYCASESNKIWSHLGVTFATAYAVLIGIVYFVQLTLVVPRLMSGNTQDIQMLIFTPFDSFLYAVDILGYSFMSVATLFASRVFTGEGLGKKVRWFLTANGLLIPFLVFQMYYHPLIFIAGLWAITFPGSTILLIIFFKRQKAVLPEKF